MEGSGRRVKQEIEPAGQPCYLPTCNSLIFAEGEDLLSHSRRYSS